MGIRKLASNTKHRNKTRVRTGKNSAAVALGKLGGKRGGPARARALTGSKRHSIAAHAAKTRWGKKTSYNMPAFYQRKAKHH